MASKEEELHFARLPAKHLDAFPVEAVRASEEPDALVDLEERILGIEITHLHLSGQTGDGGQRHQEGERAAILAEARRLAEESNVPPLSVAVHFHDDILSKSRRRALAEQLVGAVVNGLQTFHGDVLEIDNRFCRSGLSRCFRIVRIFRSSELTRHHWSAPSAGWVQTQFIDELQATIDAKNGRIDPYLKKCERCWLVVVASGFRPSSLFDPSLKTKAHRYRSRFERSFFLEAFSGNVVELLTEETGTA